MRLDFKSTEGQRTGASTWRQLVIMEGTTNFLLEIPGRAWSGLKGGGELGGGGGGGGEAGVHVE